MAPRPTLLLALLAAGAASAQPAAPLAAPAEPSTEWAVRVHGGLTGFTLGDAAAFHQSYADAYVAAGVPVPTQRSFPAAPVLGLDVTTSVGAGRHVGVGVRYAATRAYSLYGDYAGTLDLVSTVRAVLVETVSYAEANVGGPLRPYLGSRGGFAVASASTEERLDLGEIGASAASVGGTGRGFSAEGYGGLAAGRGRAGVFAQVGYRYARVGTLNGEARLDGETVEEGTLPYALGLSGFTASFGLTVRVR